MAQLLLQPVSRRPWARMMTVREHRPQQSEIDIEVALHAHSPLSTWATTVTPGQRAGIFDEGSTYRSNSKHQLLAADSTAIPAAMAIVDRAGPDFQADVVLQVSDAADIRPGRSDRKGVRIHWVIDDAPRGNSEAPLVAAVRNTDLPNEIDVWVAGEQSIPRAIRRHFVHDRRVPKQNVTFVGYWRQGHRSPG